MATYDLDRWSKQIRKRNHGEASLTLHLHPSHCRFEHQNGVFLYDSPIKGLLESIKDARLPVELLDLLDATAVNYYEGCLVVEVIDHRGVEGEAAGSAGGGSLNGISGGTDGKGHSRNASLAGGGSAADLARAGRSSHSASREAADGSILKPTSLSISMKDTNDSSKASAFNGVFNSTYKRFEAAFQDAEKLRLSAIAREKHHAEQRKLKQQQQQQAEQEQQQKQSGQNADADGNKENMPDSNDKSSIHSAVAAAVATATAMPNALAEEDIDIDAASRNKPMQYRITLGPDVETVWTDLCAIREEKKARWTEDEILAIESRVLALTAPPLCLSPDIQVSRIANSLLDATALPVTSYLPSRKREASGPSPKPSTSRLKRKKSDTMGSQKRSNGIVELHDSGEEEAEGQNNEADAQAAAQRAEDLAWMQVMDDGHQRRQQFQPSFSRLAYLQAWRERKAADEEKERKRIEDAARAEAEAAAFARENAQVQAQNGQPSRPDSRQGSVSHSRQGSVIDIPVGAPTPQTSNLSHSVVNHSATKDEEKPAPPPPKKKKASKPKDKAGRAGSPPNPNSSAIDLSASTTSQNGPTSLKLTLPGKNKKKDKNAGKAGSPDIAVNLSPTTSALASAGGNVSLSASSPAPTAAQQAINRKTANLPKAKLKSDLKAQAQQQAQNNANQSPNMSAMQSSGNIQQNQMNGSPASVHATPQMQNQQLQQNMQQQQQQLRQQGNQQMQLPQQQGQIPQQQQQRNYISPIQQGAQMPNFSPQQQNIQMPTLPNGQAMSMAQTQEYMNRLQAQISSYTQQQSNPNVNNGQAPQMNMNSQAFNAALQMQNQQRQQQQAGQFPMQQQQGQQNPPQQFGNIHRSPVHNPAGLPIQQPGISTPQPQYQYNPFNTSGSPPNMGNNALQQPQQQQQGNFGGQQGSFTAQQAFQLQQLQAQQQNMLSQHSQSLQGFGMQNNMQNMNFPQQSMNPYNPQMQPGQQINLSNQGMQNMQMPQFNPALLSQLHQQQRQQHQQQQIPMQYNPQQQQIQWQGQ